MNWVQKNTVGYCSWNARTDVVAKKRITYSIRKKRGLVFSLCITVMG